MSRELWTDFFLSKGIFDQPTVMSLVDYAVALEDQSLPVVFDLDHLALLTGIESGYIAACLRNPVSYWRTFSIPKRRGGTRQITVPYPALLVIQKWIKQSILDHVKVSPYAHAYVRKKSIVTNTRWHVGQRSLLRLDLADFFPSITRQRVLSVFRSLGYNTEVATILSKLCTYGDRLPQGAPTSPVLSNLVARPLDYRLKSLAKSYGLNYTRYADDLTFSGSAISMTFVHIAETIIREEGFAINPLKCAHFIGYEGKRIITGVSVGSERIGLPRETKRHLRQEIHYILRYGLRDHIAHCRIRRLNYLHSLIGRINFWLTIEPHNTYALRARQRLLPLLSLDPKL